MADIPALARPQPDAGLPLADSSLTDAQLDGTACISCGAAGEPLHHGQTITTRVDVGVVRDTPVIRCTSCLLRQRLRYEAAQMEPDSRSRRLWGVRDHLHNGDWVTDDSELVRFPSQDSAEGWCRRQRCLDQVGPYARP